MSQNSLDDLPTIIWNPRPRLPSDRAQAPPSGPSLGEQGQAVDNSGHSRNRQATSDVEVGQQTLMKSFVEGLQDILDDLQETRHRLQDFDVFLQGQVEKYKLIIDSLEDLPEHLLPQAFHLPRANPQADPKRPLRPSTNVIPIKSLFHHITADAEASKSRRLKRKGEQDDYKATAIPEASTSRHPSTPSVVPKAASTAGRPPKTPSVEPEEPTSAVDNGERRNLRSSTKPSRMPTKPSAASRQPGPHAFPSSTSKRRRT